MDDDELSGRVRDALSGLFPEPEVSADGVRSTPGRRPGWRSRSALAVAAAVAVVVAGAIGLAAVRSSDRPTRPAAEATDSTTPATPVDLTAVTGDVPCPLGNVRPASRADLHSLAAVAATYCTEERRTYPGDGEWQVRVRYGSDEGVAALKAAFDEPDRPLVPASSLPSGVQLGCAAVAIYSPAIVFVDAQGHWLLARAPEDSQCRVPLPEVRKAVDAQHWSTLSVTKLVQTKTAAEVGNDAAAAAAGCSAAWKNENELYAKSGGGGSRVSDGGPVFTYQPDALLHACIFETDPKDPDVGRYVRAQTFDAGGSAALRTALDGPGPTTTCAAQDRFAVIGTAKGDYVNVELGGCWRVHRDGAGPSLGSADAAALTTLLHLP